MMGIVCKDLRELIVRPVLRHLGLWSESAENLLLGTAAQETLMGRHLRQINGPALGVYQMEPATARDCWDNFLRYRGDLAAAILRIMAVRENKIDQLTWNFWYATAMCRVEYLRDPQLLPDAHDIEGLAHYWKRVWNTASGKGTVEDFVKNYTAMVQ